MRSGADTLRSKPCLSCPGPCLGRGETEGRSFYNTFGILNLPKFILILLTKWYAILWLLRLRLYGADITPPQRCRGRPFWSMVKKSKKSLGGQVGGSQTFLLGVGVGPTIPPPPTGPLPGLPCPLERQCPLNPRELLGG